MSAAHEFFEHGADIGVVGRGVGIEQAFTDAAAAMFAIMAEPEAVRPVIQIDVAFDEEDIELALVRWLNALLAQARENGAVFGRFELQRDGPHWRGRAFGERWRDELLRGTEVKGATLTALSVRQDSEGWQARCVVDV